MKPQAEGRSYDSACQSKVMLPQFDCVRCMTQVSDKQWIGQVVFVPAVVSLFPSTTPRSAAWPGGLHAGQRQDQAAQSSAVMGC